MPVSSAEFLAVSTFAPGDRVDINDPTGLKFWSAELKVSEQRLRALVNLTGMMVDDIREELARQRIDSDWNAAR